MRSYKYTEFIYFLNFCFNFFSVAVGLFVPFWYWHWLNKVSTPPLLFSPSCNKNIISSLIFPRTLNYWLLIAHWKVIRWSQAFNFGWSFFNQSIFLQDSISSFLFVQRAPQIRLCVSLIDRRQLRRTSHANLLIWYPSKNIPFFQKIRNHLKWKQTLVANKEWSFLFKAKLWSIRVSSFY